jgi:hypothetical protein
MHYHWYDMMGVLGFFVLLGSGIGYLLGIPLPSPAPPRSGPTWGMGVVIGDTARPTAVVIDQPSRRTTPQTATRA